MEREVSMVSSGIIEVEVSVCGIMAGTAVSVTDGATRGPAEEAGIRSKLDTNGGAAAKVVALLLPSAEPLMAVEEEVPVRAVGTKLPTA